jgi:putative ABC transport system ATP-binding protein
MQQAIQYGNRMIMLHQGKIQLDIRGEEKAKLTVNDVVAKFGHSLKDEALLAV